MLPYFKVIRKVKEMNDPLLIIIRPFINKNYVFRQICNLVNKYILYCTFINGRELCY